jgi:ABC-2 family transporter
MNTRLLAMMRKEFIHLIRDPGTLVTMLLFPIIYVLLFAPIAGATVSNVPTAVFDADKSSESRQLLDAYRASGYFLFTQYAQSESEIEAMLDHGTVQAGIVIPVGFGDRLVRGDGSGRSLDRRFQPHNRERRVWSGPGDRPSARRANPAAAIGERGRAPRRDRRSSARAL